MKIKLLLSIFLTIGMFSYGRGIEVASAQDSDDKSTALPLSMEIKLISDVYSVSEELATIQSTYDESQTLKLVMSDRDLLILEISYSGGAVEEAYRIEVGELNAFMTEVKLEYMDANQDGVEDELVIWWSTGFMYNGITGGYESEKRGIVVIDVMQRTTMVNFCFENLYAGYTAADDADTDDENYHAKSDDSSTWEICRFSIEIKISNDVITLGSTEIESEGLEDCSFKSYFEGTYVFNTESGQFELIE